MASMSVRLCLLIVIPLLLCASADRGLEKKQQARERAKKETIGVEDSLVKKESLVSESRNIHAAQKVDIAKSSEEIEEKQKQSDKEHNQDAVHAEFSSLIATELESEAAKQEAQHDLDTANAASAQEKGGTVDNKIKTVGLDNKKSSSTRSNLSRSATPGRPVELQSRHDARLQRARTSRSWQALAQMSPSLDGTLTPANDMVAAEQPAGEDFAVGNTNQNADIKQELSGAVNNTPSNGDKPASDGAASSEELAAAGDDVECHSYYECHGENFVCSKGKCEAAGGCTDGRCTEPKICVTHKVEKERTVSVCEDALEGEYYPPDQQEQDTGILVNNMKLVHEKSQELPLKANAAWTSMETYNKGMKKLPGLITELEETAADEHQKFLEKAKQSENERIQVLNEPFEGDLDEQAFFDAKKVLDDLNDPTNPK